MINVNKAQTQLENARSHLESRKRWLSQHLGHEPARTQPGHRNEDSELLLERRVGAMVQLVSDLVNGGETGRLGKTIN